jgi:hypothetical protein
MTVLHRAKRERNNLHTIKRKANWIEHILHMNCLLKGIIHGKIGGGIYVMRRHGRRCKQLLDDLQEKRGDWKLKQKAQDRTV